MKKIYKPNDTIVEDLDEVIKILEKTNRHILTGSIRELREQLYTLWCDQQKDLGWDKVEPTGLVEEPDESSFVPSDLNAVIRESVAERMLQAIISVEGSCIGIDVDEAFREQQVDEAFKYADAFVRRLKQ